MLLEAVRDMLAFGRGCKHEALTSKDREQYQFWGGYCSALERIESIADTEGDQPTPNEEEIPHTFRSRGGKDAHWCHDCEYHENHAVHVAAPEGDTRPRESKVTRFEVIGPKGRLFTKWDCAVELSYQDGGRTLKAFVDWPAEGDTRPSDDVTWGWQPIVTAPKDHTPLLVYRYPLIPWVGAWSDQGWMDETHYAPPTHWMPLPKSPAVADPPARQEP